MNAATADEGLLEVARAWMTGDPDPATRAELESLIASGNASELAERFSAPLEFGTAGLRGIVGAGPARMNRAVVIKTTRALAEWLLTKVPDARARPVVLGWDGRLSSHELAQDTAGVLAQAGLTVRFFEHPVPTPLVAFATRELSAIAGIAITASHNPAEYNGYKVYASNAVQIVPPVDVEVAERIARIGPAVDVPRIEGALDHTTARSERISDSLEDRYLALLDAARPSRPHRTDVAIVYTPLHGVGKRLAERALRQAGYDRLSIVPEQAEPDGRFPTVRFPNPEEPGALDLALALAQRSDADLILANDPDADRLAACVKSASGRMVQLTGNQLGLLLADYVLEHSPASPRPLVISSLVSSPMLADLAAGHGAVSESTLTGFKWIWTAALDLEARGGVRFVFGYEEALGYCVGRFVRDKDGISAAVVFADLVAQCKDNGQTALDRLDQLYRRYGLWVSVQKSVTRSGSEGVAEIAQATERAAAAPPEAVSARRVSGVRDYRSGAAERERWLGPASLVELSLEGGGRVLVRPSGTEPKLKVYVDLRVDVAQNESVRSREEAAQSEARTIAEELALRLLPN